MWLGMLLGFLFGFTTGLVIAIAVPKRPHRLPSDEELHPVIRKTLSEIFKP